MRWGSFCGLLAGALLIQPGPAAQSNSLIGGRVLEGISYSPVPGASVRLSGPAGVIATTTTGERGEYMFRGMPAGRYRLAASKSGYIEGTFGQRRPLGSDQSLELPPGGSQPHADLPVWKLGILTGLVETVDRRPIVNAKVQAFFAGSVAGRASYGALVPVEGRSDDRGAFQIQVAPGASYIVRATADARTSHPAGDSRYQSVFYPNVPASESASEISVAPDEQIGGLYFSLPVIATGRVTATIADETGRGYSRVAAMIYRRDERFDRDLDGTAGRVTADGAATFEGLEPGKYVIIAADGLIGPAMTGAGYSDVRGLTDQQRPRVRWGQAVAEVSSGQTTAVTVSLRFNGQIMGRVKVADDRATAPEQPGRVAMQVWRPDGRLLPIPSSLVEVGEDGSFATVDLPDGSYFVRPPGGVLSNGWAVASIMQAGKDITDQPIEVTTGTVSEIIVNVVKHFSEIRGRIRDEHGQYDRNATALVFPAVQKLWSDFGGAPLRFATARADQSGAYRIRALPDGDYCVVAVPDEMASNWQRQERLAALAPLASRIHLVNPEPQFIDLKTVHVPWR